ncbi:MAG: LruC domain-containing protein [Bacteroidota bacterium]
MSTTKYKNPSFVKNPAFLALILICLFSCDPFDIPEEGISTPTLEEKSINQLVIPYQFNFEMYETIQWDFTAVDNRNQPLNNVPVNIYRYENEEKRLLASGLINEEKIFEFEYRAAAHLDHLLIETTFPGLPNQLWVPIDAKTKEITLGITEGDELPTSILSTPSKEAYTQTKSAPTTNIAGSTNEYTFHYMGTYNGQGKPDYLEPTPEVVDQSILDIINTGLPEGQPVPTYNPQYITEGATTNLNLIEDAEVWVSFVHEGAGYKNSFGYYSFPTNSPPSSVDDIDSLIIAFPNVSFQGSGGQLQTGDKVSLGTFEAGTSIGWFLVPDAWSNSKKIVEQPEKESLKLSTSQFNDFTAADYRSHTVLLLDEPGERLILGFEDIDRPGGDNDFNDAIFLVTMNPFEAVNTNGIVPPTQGGEGGDEPDYPYVTYTPGEGSYGTLAFEDLWPNSGDYDMNDLVVDYNIAEYRASNNKVGKIKCEFVLQAMGAGLKNGFGFQLELNSSKIKSVTGYSHSENYITVNANGTEAGQTKATIIVFDNGDAIMPSPGTFVNTVPTEAYIQPDTIIVEIELENNEVANNVGYPPYNPFLIKGMNRGLEVHLPNKAPTDLADMSILGTEDDDSNPGSGRYYKTSTHLPWAINLPSSFDYPMEKEAVNVAHEKFSTWAQSGGDLFNDWFLDLSGYRNEGRIYQKD